MMKIALGLILAVSGISSAGAIPQTLNFQGRLSESGALVNGSRDITFRIFASQSGGNPLFTETHSGQNSVSVSTGVFNALIGSLTPDGIPLSVFDGQDKYVEVQVGNISLPRQRIVSVGYAFRSAMASTSTFAERAGSVDAAAALSVATVTTTMLNATQIAASTITASNIQTGELKVAVGEDGVFTSAANNSITFTQPLGSPIPILRTAAPGQQGNVANTGSTVLRMNAGLGGSINLNPVSTGAVTMSQSPLSNVGIGTLTPGFKLHVAALAGTAGDILVVSTGTSNMFRVLGTGEVIAAKFTGAATDNTKVARTGDTMTGPLNMTNTTVNLTGPNGNVVGQASVTASAFFGDGAGLTNITATDASKVAKAGDTMTGALSMTNAAVNLSGPNGNVVGRASMTASAFFGDGANLMNLTGANVVGNIPGNAANITGNLAPSQIAAGNLPGSVIASAIAANAVQDASIVSVSGAKVTGNIPGNAANVTGIVPIANGGTSANTAAGALTNLGAVAKTGDTMTGALNMNNTAVNLTGVNGNVIGRASVTASAFFGDGANLSNLTGTNVVGNIPGNAANITGSLAPTQIAAGNLAGNVIASAIAANAVQDTSIVSVSGSKVSGNIPGNAANVTGIVPIANGGTNANTSAGALANLGAVAKAGDTMTGSLNMNNVAVNLTGPNGNVVGQASMTASAFFGDGSHLSGVMGTTISAGIVFNGIPTQTSAPNQGVLYYDSTTNAFYVSENGGVAKPIVDPPGTWTCTVRSGSCGLTTSGCSATVSCSGNEKALSGGCNVLPTYTVTNIIGAIASGPNGGQGWTCAASGQQGSTLTAYVNCCK